MSTRLLIPQKDIEKRVLELAKEIQKRNKKPFVLLGVLNGAYMLVSDLSKALWNIGVTDFSVDFVGISSYQDATTSSRKPTITKEPTEIEGKHIIIVEDIIDTGHSISFLKTYLQDKNCASVQVCTLLSKPSRREIPVTIDYVGFEIEDKWVEGYGMDTAGMGRGNPDIVERLEK